jgi:hypothetical protein
LTLPECPHCHTVYWHPYEQARGWCNYCDLPRRLANLKAWWPEEYADELTVREAFAQNGSSNIPDSAGAYGGLHHLPPSAGRPLATIRSGEVRSNRRQS